VKSRTSAALMAMGLAGAVTFAGVAEARNPNCAGGIQYLSQAMKDKEKGNTVDYEREISKAVQRLEMCQAEDPADFEAIGYLAWAYAEVDSACPAGVAFDKAIEGLKTKDKKKVPWAENNRESYWATKFNEGIAKINAAQAAYPDFAKEPADDAEKTLKAEARKAYEQALLNLQQARCLKPSDPRTSRNLGTTYAFMGDYPRAEELLAAAMTAAPNDSDLAGALLSVKTGRAVKMVNDQKYDEAIPYYEGLVKEHPDDGNLWQGLADATFKRAQLREGDARKADFCAAARAFAKAGTIKSDDASLPFNAALAFQSCGSYDAAEVQWRESLKRSPDDADAESALGATLAELKKFDEAVTHVHRAVTLDPKNKARHRQLGAVYTKAGNNAKATEELMVFLALQNGQAAANTAEQIAKASGDAADTRRESGDPEEIYLWEADGEKYESWFYWSKNVAQHFKVGSRVEKVQRSDWSAPGAKGAK
jgi:tetratricopeptide (TPR) repeat protein